jgi:hypothetical protein
MSGSFPARVKLADICGSVSATLDGRLRKLPTMHNAINGQSFAQLGAGASFGQHGISAPIGIAAESDQTLRRIFAVQSFGLKPGRRYQAVGSCEWV